MNTTLIAFKNKWTIYTIKIRDKQDWMVCPQGPVSRALNLSTFFTVFPVLSQCCRCLKLRRVKKTYLVQKPVGTNKTSATYRQTQLQLLHCSLTSTGKARSGCRCMHISLHSAQTVLWEPPLKVALSVPFLYQNMAHQRRER